MLTQYMVFVQWESSLGDRCWKARKDVGRGRKTLNTFLRTSEEGTWFSSNSNENMTERSAGLRAFSLSAGGIWSDTGVESFEWGIINKNALRQKNVWKELKYRTSQRQQWNISLIFFGGGHWPNQESFISILCYLFW